MNFKGIFHSKLLRFYLSVAAVLLTTVALATLAEHVNLITVALALLLIVLASATFFGRNPALLASFVAMLCFNYFFIPPVHTWTISDPQNLVAWADLRSRRWSPVNCLRMPTVVPARQSVYTKSYRKLLRRRHRPRLCGKVKNLNLHCWMP